MYNAVAETLFTVVTPILMLAAFVVGIVHGIAKESAKDGETNDTQ